MIGAAAAATAADDRFGGCARYLFLALALALACRHPLLHPHGLPDRHPPLAGSRLAPWLDGPRLVGPRLVPDWSQAGPRLVPDWSQAGPRLVPGLCQAGQRMLVPRCSQAGPRLATPLALALHGDDDLRERNRAVALDTGSVGRGRSPSKKNVSQ